jgi:hypothetical protein
VPFTKEEISQGLDFDIENQMDHFINQDIRDEYGNETANVLDAYLQRRKGDSLTPKLFNNSNSEIVKGFIEDPTTLKKQKDIIRAIKRNLATHCPSLPENKWTPFDLKDLVPIDELNEGFSFTGSTPPTIPGILAGGISSSHAGPDSRNISGTIQLFRTVSGGKTTVKMRTNFHFLIKDAFKFCPGNMGNPLARIITVPLSRLEASNLAYDVPFEVHYPGPVIEIELDPVIVSICYSK